MYNNINMAMYEQMGFTKQQVKRAEQYSQKNKIDMFDALQYLQRRQSEGTKNGLIAPSKSTSSNNPIVAGSILYPFKNVNLNNYEIVFSKKASRMNLPGKKIDLRQQFSPVGLLNVHNCCYLNSLLQCYFLSSDLIKYILEAEPLSSLQGIDPKKNPVKAKRIQNEYNLLHTLKQIFSRMCLTSKRYIDPTEVLRNLVDSFGQKIQYGDEKDLFQTNIMIIERLNECLLYTKKYFKSETNDIADEKTRDQFISTNSSGKSFINQSKIKQRDNIKRLFYGQKVQYTDPINNKKDVDQILSDFVGIIINPGHQNLNKALHQEFHYEVEIEIPEQKRKVKTKKHTYIRQMPLYLYFYINRTGYNAEEKQALKNQDKLSFDFVIYLDRFMEKYSQESSANNELIVGLWKKKNLLQKKRNSFDLFAKKLQECRKLASLLEGWKQKLPEQQDINSQKQATQKELQNIEKELQKIESRKQKYCLMYIFVHRGDAVSGHYWGYGRNAQNWYKFDINTNKMKQEEILLDLYKCGGTPYALVYVKEQNLPKIDYKYHKDFSVIHHDSLIDMSQTSKQKQNAYISLVPQGIKKVILAENVQLHQEFTKRRNFQITSKVVKEYLIRFNWVETETKQIQKSESAFKLLPSYDNFAVYLSTKHEVQMAKYNIYSSSLKAVANLSPVEVMDDEVLLASIQKEFRKKVKKNKALKHFCIEFEPQQGDKYLELFKNYIFQKEAFIILLRVISIIETISQSQKENNSIEKELHEKINRILRRVALLNKSRGNNNSYIKFILAELINVFILKVTRAKCVLRLSNEELKLLASEKLIQQVQILAGKQYIVLDNRSLNQKEYEQSRRKNQKAEELWYVQQIGKGPNRQILQKKFSPALNFAKDQVQIFRKLSKQGKFTQINKKTGQLEDYNQIKINQIVQSESLI